MPEYLSSQNPVLLDPELKPHQLETVARIVLNDHNVDALLIVYTPGLGTDAIDNANALILLAKESNKTFFCSWMGEYSVSKARSVFDSHSIPNFDTPDSAIKAFMYMVSHMRTQTLMQQTPHSIVTPAGYSPDIARQLPKHDVIMPQLAWQLIRSYGFYTADNLYTKKAENLKHLSRDMSPPWVVKLHHKAYLKPFAYGLNARQRWRSVALNITQPMQIESEVARLNQELQHHYPDSEIVGYSIQSMYRALDNMQISLGIGRDAEVGPFIFFGGGGTTADILTDRQVAVPPLNTALARHLIERSHASQVLRERSEKYDKELLILSHWLVGLSQLSSQYPSISGLELNAIRSCSGEFLILGVAGETSAPVTSTFKAYPSELEEVVRNHNRIRFNLRPIKAEDEFDLAVFYKKLSPESLRFRFFNSRKHFDHKELSRFAQIDYDREMAFVAKQNAVLAGVVRSWIDPDSITAEFAVLVGDEYAGQRLGYMLMKKMIHYLTHKRGVLQLIGSVLPNNYPMLKLAQRLGFSIDQNTKDGFIELVLQLNEPEHEWQRKRLYVK